MQLVPWQGGTQGKMPQSPPHPPLLAAAIKGKYVEGVIIDDYLPLSV